MKIEVKIDEAALEPRIIIQTKEITEELMRWVKSINSLTEPYLMGYKNNSAEMLNPKEIVRIFAADKKIFAEKGKEEYLLRQRLYELENILEPKKFVRISNSEIINLKYVQKFDLSFSGTICIILSNGNITYTSRRYISRIKKNLGL